MAWCKFCIGYNVACNGNWEPFEVEIKKIKNVKVPKISLLDANWV